MNLVLNTALLFFCFGLTYSSGVNSSSDVVPHTVKSSTLAPEVQSVPVKIETLPPTHNPSTLHSVTVETTTLASSSVKVDPVTAETKSKPPLVTDNTNASAKGKNTTTVTEVIPKHENTTSTNNSVPAETKISTQKSTVTTIAATLATTAAPVVSKSDQAVPTPATQERQFDGPSFVGGIVLTVGLTVIGFIAFKFYKSGKSGRNYSTL